MKVNKNNRTVKIKTSEISPTDLNGIMKLLKIFLEDVITFMGLQEERISPGGSQ